MARIIEKIMGRQMELDVDIDSLTFASIVAYVNEVWEEAQKANKNVPDTQKIVTLTAIMLAEELLKLKGSQKSISDNYEKKIKNIIKELDEVNFSG